MYNVHAYMHIMQCTICNFGFYSLGRISSANLHIFAFISDEMHVIAIFDQKRVKLHFPGDIKYIADSSRCLVSSAYPFQCTMCCLGSMFSFQPNKLRHILKFMSWYTIEHIFVPACSVGRKTWFLRKPWFSNSKFAISGLFFPILSAPKIMFPVPENKKRDKF